MKRIIFCIGILMCFLFCSPINGQTKNWKNHKMTTSEVKQMGDEYKTLSIDMAIAKFLNDMEYLPRLFPLLIKRNEMATIAPSGQTSPQDLDTFLLEIPNLLQKKIKLHQYFTSLRDDTVAIDLSLPQKGVNKFLQINGVQFANAYIGDNTFSDFQSKGSDTKVLASSSLLDSIHIIVDINLVTKIDTILWKSDDQNCIVDGGDTLFVTTETSNYLNLECPTRLFNRLIDYQAYNKDELLPIDSILISSPIVEFNYLNTMALLDEFAILRDSIVQDITKYDTDITFNSALDSILVNFQLKEVLDKYIIKLYCPKSINRISFYFIKYTEQQTLDITIPLREDYN